MTTQSRFLKKFVFSFVLSLSLLSPLAFAQPMPSGGPMDQAPMFAGMKMGVLNGVIFKNYQGKKTPLAGQSLSITVFHDGQPMLSLKKQADAQGAFQFKRIFKDPSYSYTLQTSVDGQTYGLSDLKLDPSKDSLDVSFEVSEKTAMKGDIPEADAPATPPMGAGAPEALPPGHPGGAQAPEGAEGTPPNMPPMAQQPQFAGMSMGVINGTMVDEHSKGHKSPIKDQPVAIIVFQNGQRVLMLNKKTDAEGRFQFKNIFKDPSYSYTLGTMLDNKLYLMKDIQLEASKDEKKVEFPVGDGSPYLAIEDVEEAQTQKGAAGPSQMLQADRKAGDAARAERPSGSFWQYSYQKIAIVLGGLAIAAALFYAFRKESNE